MRERKIKYIQPEALELAKKKPFMPLYIAAAVMEVSRHNFKKYFGHLIQPVELPGRTRTLYKTEDVLSLPFLIKTKTHKPLKSKNSTIDIRSRMEKAYLETMREVAACQ